MKLCISHLKKEAKEFFQNQDFVMNTYNTDLTDFVKVFELWIEKHIEENPNRYYDSVSQIADKLKGVKGTETKVFNETIKMLVSEDQVIDHFKMNYNVNLDQDGIYAVRIDLLQAVYDKLVELYPTHIGMSNRVRITDTSLNKMTHLFSKIKVDQKHFRKNIGTNYYEINQFLAAAIFKEINVFFIYDEFLKKDIDSDIDYAIQKLTTHYRYIGFGEFSDFISDNRDLISMKYRDLFNKKQSLVDITKTFKTLLRHNSEQTALQLFIQI